MLKTFTQNNCGHSHCKRDTVKYQFLNGHATHSIATSLELRHGNCSLRGNECLGCRNLDITMSRKSHLLLKRLSQQLEAAQKR